jgi:glycosyltransferase involved in cell wall biosynthesis
MRLTGDAPEKAAVVYSATAGIGGLGHSAAAGIAAVAKGRASTYAFGPGRGTPWALGGGDPPVTWVGSPRVIPPWMTRYTWLRWRSGQATMLNDRGLGRWAASEVSKLRPQSCYLFTQVALETLRWARREGVPTVLDNPNGHIRNFREVLERESQRWFGKRFHGHPTAAMIDRVEEEYSLADRIRVYAEWGRESMSRYQVPGDRLHVLRQTVNLEKFRPSSAAPREQQGPLRVCFVGSLDLRKGFVYLLKAIRLVGAQHIRLRFVGATGDRDCARLLARERAGLDVECAPGDPLPVYQDSELFVVPTLEDGLPFVLLEGLACGLPVIVTEEAGAAECVKNGRSGWVVPAAQPEALAAALETALRQRNSLPEMGRCARLDVEKYAGPAQLEQLSQWFYNAVPAAVQS